MTYISSQSIATPMRLSVLQLQAEMTQTQTEISTGTKADIGLSLGAQTGTALSFQDEIDSLNAYTNTNALATTRLSATSNALDTLLSSAQTMAQNVTSATGAGGTATLGTSAQSALQSLIGALNTSVGGQFIFGGINTDTTPIASYTATSNAKTAVDSAFASAFGGSPTSTAAASITGSQMQSFLDNQFSTLFSDANWSADWSSASNSTIQSAVSPSQSITTSVSANETSLRQITQAYTMLTEFTGQNLGTEAQNAVLATASKLMSSGIAGLTNVSSGVGVAQSTLSTAGTQITSQVNLLTSNVSSLEGVDTAALSTKITQLQTQLEASYELTSRISQLSLVNYLTAG